MTEVVRDRWQRPLIVPREGGKPVPYTRCTQYVSVLDDTWNLSLWKQRKVAEGMALRDDLVVAAKLVGTDPGKLEPAAQRVWRDRLNQICAKAQEAADADGASKLGTYLHSLTERLDAGEQVGDVPPELHKDLDAYLDATEPLSYVGIERFVVQDDHLVGGTYDRMVELDGQVLLPDGTPAVGKFIGDLKTGSIAPGILKIAMQLGTYANSVHYDPDTCERTEHGARTDWGIIIHLPAGTGKCELHWVDIAEGWRHVETCRAVKAARSISFKKITAPVVV